MVLKRNKIVCLGGGIGTVNLIRGLSKYDKEISVIVSLADEGGSSGRLRRLYNIAPIGDLVSCMSAFNADSGDLLTKLLTYRFPGDRYGKDDNLGGHKLGNLIMASMINITGSLKKAVDLFQKTFRIPGEFYTATEDKVTISARTIEGKIIHGEEAIDLGKYNGKRVLEKVYLHPGNASISPDAKRAICDANIIIAGPGDLYTTILPVLIVPEIKEILSKSKAKKIFIINIANKPFETKGYHIIDFIEAIKNHLGTFPFDNIICNNNFKQKIPQKYHYKYVTESKTRDEIVNYNLLFKDLADPNFPIYHNSSKLAKAVLEII